MKVILEAQHACTDNPRGIGRYTVALIRHLLQRGKYSYGLTFFDYHGQVGNRKHIEQYFGSLEAEVHECNSLHYYDAFTGEEKDSYEAYTSAQGDVFHFMHYIKFPRWVHGAVVVTVHDIMPLLFPKWFEPRIAEYAKFFAKKIKETRPLLLANSHCTKMDVVNYLDIPEEDIVFIPHAYDTDTCFPEKNPGWLRNHGIESPYLLYMGPIDERKNIPALLEAFRLLSSRFSEIKMVIAGIADKRSERKLYQMFRAFPYQDRLHLLGVVTDDERRYLFSQAEAFVFPSQYEGFGVPVLEAFACGCPVITSDVSALPEVGGDAAVFVNPTDVEALSCCMEKLIGNVSLRNELVQRGFQQAKKFSWERTAIMTEQAYAIALRRCEKQKRVYSNFNFQRCL